jgi:hypothetical protein
MFSYESNRGHEIGVSEVVGFLIIFTIIIMGIGLVTLYSYPVLLQQQSSANERVMEKNMIVLQNDLKSLSYSMVPFSETSMSIGGGALVVYNATNAHNTATFDIECDGTPLIPPGPTGKIQYESVDSQTDIALENSAVVMRKTNAPGSTMLAEPRWFYDSPTNTAVLYLISFNSTDAMARAGIGTVTMERGSINHPPPFPVAAGSTCTVRYTPDSATSYSTAWNNYFTSTFSSFLPPAPGGYVILDRTRPGQIILYLDDIKVRSV